MRNLRTVAAGIGLAAVLAATGCSSDTGTTQAAGDGTAAPAADGPSGEFTMLSYNVAGLPQEISKENPEVNIPLISPRLEPYDVVLTQEDFDWWQDQLDTLDFANYHTRLGAATTFDHRSEPHPGPEAVGLDTAGGRPDPFVGDGLGTLSRLPFRDMVRVPWTSCFGGADTKDGGAGDCLSMKGFSVATFTLAEGVEVDIYNLHGEAGGSAEDQRLQAEGYRQLAAFMAEHSAGRAVLLAGDTNLHTADPDHEDADDGADLEIWTTFLEATGLTDVCTTLDCGDDDGIDKAAYRSGGGVTLAPTARAYVREDFLDDAGEDLSDHPPLEVTWSWRAG